MFKRLVKELKEWKKAYETAFVTLKLLQKHDPETFNIRDHESFKDYNHRIEKEIKTFAGEEKEEG